MQTLPMPGGKELVQERAPLPYTDAERQFSRFVQERMYRLLRGDDNALVLMRRYHSGKQEVSFFMPSRLRKGDIRGRVAEEIVYGVLRFLDPFAPGGPVVQEELFDRLTEVQTFPTQYPHIVVERMDVFDKSGNCCQYVEWRAVRLQNQRKSTLINRAVDMANLALEISRFFPLPLP